MEEVRGSRKRKGKEEGEMAFESALYASSPFRVFVHEAQFLALAMAGFCPTDSRQVSFSRGLSGRCLYGVKAQDASGLMNKQVMIRKPILT